MGSRRQNTPFFIARLIGQGLLDGDCDRLAAEVDAALSGLDTVAGSNAQRVKVAARVAAELVPARFRGAGPAG
jgi:hypothetical protein